MKDSRVICLFISSQLKNLAKVRATIKDWCIHSSQDESRRYQLELCVVEAVTNSIKHAYALEPDKTVTIHGELFEDHVVLEVSDTGKTMTEMSTEEINFDFDNPDTAPEGGMGLKIIHSIMDEVCYQHHHGQNTLRMSKYFNKT